jgi:hypothetical protein
MLGIRSAILQVTSSPVTSAIKDSMFCTPWVMIVFGLPAEQYAIQTGQHPEITTKTNIARYREQLDKIGFAYDWDREVQTSDPNYYHWTQWIFSLIYNSWFNLDTNKAEHISVLVEKFNQNGSYNVNAAIDADWYKNLPADRFPLFGKKFRRRIYCNGLEKHERRTAPIAVDAFPHGLFGR